MSWPVKYRRQAHRCLVTYELTGERFFYLAAQTYLDLAREWDERKTGYSKSSA